MQFFSTVDPGPDDDCQACPDINHQGSSILGAKDQKYCNKPVGLEY